MSGINAALMLLLVGTSLSSTASFIKDPIEFWIVLAFATVGGVRIILRASVPGFRVEESFG